MKGAMETATDTIPAEVDVAIVGSGFSGLCMAIKLREAGVDDFVVLERGDAVGGTWWFNTYPGCACDIPSHLYSFSFAPNPDWTRTYSKQAEIEAYLQRVAEDFDVERSVRFGTTVTGADWDEDEQRWHVATDRGDLSARVLVSAAGALSDPKTPDIEGIDRFQGRMFHSAQWDHDYDVEGKRIAVIGTGASAIQFVPAIAPDVRQMHVFQRTAPWIMPHTDRPISPRERALYRRFPLLQRLVRGGIYSAFEMRVLGFVKQPRLMKLLEAIPRKHMDRQISDPELRRKVEPGYTLGCKRILPSNKWYPALGRDNVELVTDGVQEVREHSIVTGAGEEIAVDAIIFGTGFNVTDMPVARYVRGRGGRTLDEHWQGSPQGAPGRDRARLPEPVHAARPQHGPRAQLDGLHDRVPGRARDGRAEDDARPRRRDARGQARGRARLQRRARRADEGHGLEHGLQELVPRRHGAQRDPVAGLDVPVPPPRRALRRRRVRARRRAARRARGPVSVPA